MKTVVRFLGTRTRGGFGTLGIRRGTTTATTTTTMSATTAVATREKEERQRRERSRITTGTWIRDGTGEKGFDEKKRKVDESGFVRGIAS